MAIYILKYNKTNPPNGKRDWFFRFNYYINSNTFTESEADAASDSAKV